MIGIYIDYIDFVFKEASFKDEIYVDKTELISILNKRLCTKQKYICISRPRRFGKSLTASMICSYYSKGQDNHELFKNFKIANDPSYKKHLNKYHTIFINITDEFNSADRDVKEMISSLTQDIVKDLKELRPDITYTRPTVLSKCLEEFFRQTEEFFVIVIDEWDAILREKQEDTEGIKLYLEWLKGLLKDKSYVALAYMTGILPIKKYNTQSALNMFDEFSMTDPKIFAQYIGFTEDEVKELCHKYNKDFNDMQSWYDGYKFKNDLHIYNPNSVVKAIYNDDFSSYWTKTESFEGLREYINLNFDGVKDSITKLIAGESVECNTAKFANDMTSLSTANNVLTLLIHLGYLSLKENLYDKVYTITIPNNEIASEFRNSLEDNEKYADIYELVKDTNKLLQSIWNKDEKAVAKTFDINHQKYTSIIKYNDENSLASVIAISLLLSTSHYVSKREVQAGKGFADMIYLPKKGKTAPALIVELKYDKTADTAIKQIKERQYINYFDDYKGKVLLVGINYDTKSKEHDCKIEELTI